MEVIISITYQGEKIQIPLIVDGCIQQSGFLCDTHKLIEVYGSVDLAQDCYGDFCRMADAVFQEHKQEKRRAKDVRAKQDALIATPPTGRRPSSMFSRINQMGSSVRNMLWSGRKQPQQHRAYSAPDPVQQDLLKADSPAEDKDPSKADLPVEDKGAMDRAVPADGYKPDDRWTQGMLLDAAEAMLDKQKKRHASTHKRRANHTASQERHAPTPPSTPAIVAEQSSTEQARRSVEELSSAIDMAEKQIDRKIGALPDAPPQQELPGLVAP
eukprot:gb/GFBE01079575.1/.p1 GENE.gb/GFBE01079575.1/~~gb/GFBE01079575.1/.p1  ORF type:complete len:270 (+),score=31.59 gb/GFBE01079575.1/:1-810(+)